MALKQTCQLGKAAYSVIITTLHVCAKSLGDFVLTANNVYISDNVHGYEGIHTPIINQPVLFKDVVEVGSSSWIGENACIIGVKVGKNCVIWS